MPDSLFSPDGHLETDQLIALSQAFLACPARPITTRMDIVTVEAGGLTWDIGGAIYEPADPAQRMTAPDGRSLGFFLIHGGEGDYRAMARMARLLASHCGVRVVSMTYPGRLAFDDPDHRWHGDTLRPDGSVRTPQWQRGEQIVRDEYDIVSDPATRAVYGTRTLARALPGSRFHRRMAGWPLAMEEGAKALMARHFPPEDWAVLIHGHSTGGPVSHYLLQRVENIIGLAGIENSQFGYIWAEMSGTPWPNGFEDLVIRTWRDKARYIGAEALKSRGPEALMALPALMEDVFEAWETALDEPNFKAEYILHVNCERELTRAAQTTAAAMGLDAAGTEAMVRRYLGYGRPLTGPEAPPLPPVLYITCALSRDHTAERYRQIAIPMMRAITPQPKVALMTFGTGTHYYVNPLPGLPEGLCPPAIMVWMDALKTGYFSGR